MIGVVGSADSTARLQQVAADLSMSGQILVRSYDVLEQAALSSLNQTGAEPSTLRQMLARPVPRWNTYRTPVQGVYLASSATPPGPAVHGMCGDLGARVALRDVFGVREVPPLRPALR